MNAIDLFISVFRTVRFARVSHISFQLQMSTLDFILNVESAAETDGSRKSRGAFLVLNLARLKSEQGSQQTSSARRTAPAATHAQK